jgi:hypothetical protein
MKMTARAYDAQREDLVDDLGNGVAIWLRLSHLSSNIHGPEKRGIQPSVWGPCTRGACCTTSPWPADDRTSTRPTTWLCGGLSRCCLRRAGAMAGYQDAVRSRRTIKNGARILRRSDSGPTGSGGNSAAGKPPTWTPCALIYEGRVRLPGSLNRYFLPFVAACSAGWRRVCSAAGRGRIMTARACCDWL